MEVNEGSDKKSDIYSYWMAAHVRLKNEFTKEEKYHNLMTFMETNNILMTMIYQQVAINLKILWLRQHIIYILALG